MSKTESESVQCPIDGHDCRRVGCCKNWLVPSGLDCDQAVLGIVGNFVANLKGTESAEQRRPAVKRTRNLIYDLSEELGVNPQKLSEIVEKNVHALSTLLP